MRLREVAVVTLVLLAASVPLSGALPTPPPGPFLPHAPISITSDAGFTAANGVVSGTGAPGDPYVISGWNIAGGSVGIRIHNVTKEFTIRDNAIDSSIGIMISASASVGLVLNNQLVVSGTGILVTSADATIRDNSFVGEGSSTTNKGVDLVNSNSRVESNAFFYTPIGIRAERGSPQILCNDIHDDTVLAGITLHFTTNATVDCNIITRCVLGISVVGSIGPIVTNNTISNCWRGIDVQVTKDLTAANNTIRFSLYTQVKLDIVSGNVTGNVIIDGQADAMVIVKSPVLVANNTIHNNLRVGLRIEESGADVEANVVSYNNVGIQLAGGSIVHFTANVMTNNTVGIDIPYESRQTIVNMSANFVNGVNIDGSVNASQRVYFYHQSNVTIEGQVRDSGFSAGFYGSITAQGSIVLYEVDTANINATVISHHNVGIGVVNSFNVNVNGSVLVSNLVGIKAEVRISGGTQVPNCVVSVKDTNVTIPVDPIATVGIDVRGCFAIVGRTNVSVVDTGIRVDGSGSITLFNSTVFDTKLALDIAGRPGEVNLTGNVLVNNRAGARLSGTEGVLTANTFLDNDAYGLRLENGAELTLVANNFTANGQGIVDAEVCLGPLSCSSVTARQNSFIDNVGDGASVNGVTSWRGDVALGNGGIGFNLSSSSTLDSVVARGNGEDGARVVGTFDIADSIFTANEGDGLDLRGSGELRDSTFTFNEEAGIRMAATFVTGLRLNVSFNFDGIVTSEGAALGGPLVASVPGIAALVTGSTGDGGDPFDIHRSTFLGNERDAIRAGAAVINATHNYWGAAAGPRVSVADTIGAFQNGVSPAVRFLPYYTDPTMTTTGPVAGL